MCGLSYRQRVQQASGLCHTYRHDEVHRARQRRHQPLTMQSSQLLVLLTLMSGVTRAPPSQQEPHEARDTRSLHRSGYLWMCVYGCGLQRVSWFVCHHRSSGESHGTARLLLWGSYGFSLSQAFSKQASTPTANSAGLAAACAAHPNE